MVDRALRCPWVIEKGFTELHRLRRFLQWGMKSIVFPPGLRLGGAECAAGGWAVLTSKRVMASDLISKALVIAYGRRGT